MASPFPPALERLIKNITRMPGIGEKTATRMAMQIMRWPASQAAELADSIATIHERIRLCSTCFTFSEQDPCPVCDDLSRDHSLLCVVEEPGDFLALEKSGAFQGVYHVLHGALSPLDGIGPDELRLERLMARTKDNGVKEVVIATSSTVAGEATASYIADMLEKEGIGISRIACGIPMGMNLKYADNMTLQRALESRVSLNR